MCGLVGVAGNKLNTNEKNVFRTLLSLDILRGKDSTGVAAIGRNGDWDMHKRKGTAWDMFDSKRFDDVMRPVSYAYIGHNRAATKGKVNNMNAHPFEMEDVVGCHNGTLRGQHRLPDHQDFEVDSENIMHAIQLNGLEATLEILDGAYALSYWDKRDQTLVLVRNNERTLYFAYSEDRKNVFWASEAWMISVACSRNNVKIGQIYEIAANTIYRFNIDKKLNGEVVSVNCRAFTPFVPPVTHSKGYSNVYGGQPAKKHQPSSNVSPPQQSKFAPNSKKITDPPSMIGQDVEIMFDRVVRSGHINYASFLMEGWAAEARIICPADSKLEKELQGYGDALLKAKIRTYGYSNSQVYFILDSMSLEEVIEEDDDGDEEDVHLVFDNKIVDEQEFIRKTQRGCAWCTDTPIPEESDTLEWLSDDSFVCRSCADLAEVKEYTGA